MSTSDNTNNTSAKPNDGAPPPKTSESSKTLVRHTSANCAGDKRCSITAYVCAYFAYAMCAHTDAPTTHNKQTVKPEFMEMVVDVLDRMGGYGQSKYIVPPN